MFGLIRDFAITIFIILLAQGVYEVDDISAFNDLVGFIVEHQKTFLGTGFICLVVLLIGSAVLEEIGLYKITYGMSKILVRLSQFFITFFSILNIGFYSTMGENFLLKSGYLTIILLFLILGASCWTIRINDFSYHSKNAMVPVGVLAVMSVILVSFIWPMMGF